MITSEGVFVMKQDEMLSELHLIFASRYKQVSAPQYYQGQGPYLMTLAETGDSCEFHCYEILDVETFLSAPEQFSPAFYEPEFLFKVADTLDLNGIKDSGRYFSLLLHKVVPDTPSCRLALQKMYSANPELAEKIIFVNDNGILLSCAAVLRNQVLLN